MGMVVLREAVEIRDFRPDAYLGFRGKVGHASCADGMAGNRRRRRRKARFGREAGHAPLSTER
jgi:hypothetical protein